MSVKAIRLVLDHTQAKGGARLVLLVLAEHCNGKRGDLLCWPSLRTIQKETGLAESTVCQALNLLEEIGEIRRRRSAGGRHKQTQYAITLGEKHSDYRSVSDQKHSDYRSRNTPITGDALNRKLNRKLTCVHPSPHQECIKCYYDLFFEKFKTKPSIGPADAKYVKDLLSDDHSVEEIKSVVRFYFTYPDSFDEKNGLFSLKQIASPSRYTKTLARMAAHEDKIRSY